MFPIAPVSMWVEAECFPLLPCQCGLRQSVSHCSRVNVGRGRVFPIAPVSMWVEAECFPLLRVNVCRGRVFPIAPVSMCAEAECFPLLPCQCG